MQEDEDAEALNNSSLPGAEALFVAGAPYLIGIRHHAPSLAAAMPALLDASRPDVVAIELPVDAQPWIEHLSHSEAIAPVTLAFSDGDRLGFYPFADFSPELSALRWAREHGVEVVCIDLPVAARVSCDDTVESGPVSDAPTLGRVLAERFRALRPDDTVDHDELWDRSVEASAPGSTPEQVRRAALAHGWALRRDVERWGIDARTLAREAHMRLRLAELDDRRVTAVVGSLHAPVLLEESATSAEVSWTVEQDVEVRAALVPYSFAQLDSRSGYAAGIRDPGWQQLVLDSWGRPEVVDAAMATTITEIARGLRSQGFPAGPGEISEALRMTRDLAGLRGLPAASRRELVEAVTSVFAHGEVMGRGRAVAGVLESVLVGTRRGTVAPGTPISALRESVRAELAAAHLPTEPVAGRPITLYPLRGGSDLRRHVLLRRLSVARIPYSENEEKRTTRGLETLGTVWNVRWTAATEAGLDVAAARGLSAEEIAWTTLLSRLVAIERGADAGLRAVIGVLGDGADCAIGWAVDRTLELLAGLALHADFADAVSAHAALTAVGSARIPGAALLSESTREQAAVIAREFETTALREIPGLAGSDDPEDARALVEFCVQAGEQRLGLSHELSRLREEGSPLMQGAAIGITLTGTPESAGGADADLAATIGSWLDASTPSGRTALRRRLAGLLTVTGTWVVATPALEPLVERVSTTSDAHFVELLPSLRGGFDVLGPEGCARLLDELAREHGRAADFVLSPEETLRATNYDARARDRLAALGLADLAFTPAERWRLVLGQERNGLSAQGRRMASALDELYGFERSDAIDAGMRLRGADRGPSHVSVRAWADEIEALFPQTELEEIFGQAAGQGRVDVLEHLDPEHVTPSVELLSTALSVTGALSEARLVKLRPLVARLVAELMRELAVQLRPALTGVASARPTRRRTARIDLPRTIRANLRHLIMVPDEDSGSPGSMRPQIVPDTPVFMSRVQKESDWHLIIVVDVSGSMSESVVFSALCAAILSGVRTLRVTFLAFSREVVDFSEHVTDPLALLLEVDIGGGTNIAKAMRAARERVRVPARTLCVVVSDFEEFGSAGPLLAEVEALHTSGVHLLGCAALNDSGQAVYNLGVARAAAGAGMRVAAVSPLELARWVGQVMRG